MSPSYLSPRLMPLVSLLTDSYGNAILPLLWRDRSITLGPRVSLSGMNLLPSHYCNWQRNGQAGAQQGHRGWPRPARPLPRHSAPTQPPQNTCRAPRAGCPAAAPGLGNCQVRQRPSQRAGPPASRHQLASQNYHRKYSPPLKNILPQRSRPSSSHFGHAG